MILAKANRRDPMPHDRVKYRWRARIERLFNKLKNWRRVATRYDKTAESYIGFIGLASALLWIPFVRAAYSRHRRGEHPQAYLASWSGIFQADAYGGYGALYRDARNTGPVLEAGCFAHARRKFFELADVEGTARKKSRGERSGMDYSIALEAVKRLDALFDIERAINGKPAAERRAVRQELSAPLMAELHIWLTGQRSTSSPALVSTTSTSYSTTDSRTSWAKTDPPRGLQRMDTAHRPAPAKPQLRGAVSPGL